MDPVIQSAGETAQTLAAYDFSVLALFWRADWVVKLVMLGLIGASIWSWAIIFEKFILVRRLFQRSQAFEQLFWSGESLQNIYRKTNIQADHPMARLFNAAMREWVRATERGRESHKASDKEKPKAKKQDVLLSHSLGQRIDRILTVTIAREMAQIEKRMLFLASVGAVAPFIGLFGTVWGIMNSFQAIALSRDTNLAVVAPGIAEALFATGLGLLAAIPAVIAYNKFSNDMTRLANQLDIFADEFSNIVSRQIDMQDG